MNNIASNGKYLYIQRLQPSLDFLQPRINLNCFSPPTKWILVCEPNKCLRSVSVIDKEESQAGLNVHWQMCSAQVKR